MEVSVPPSAVLRKLYMFYVRRVIPLIGLLLLGKPENYRLLTKAALHTRIGVGQRVQLRLRRQWPSFLIIRRESGDWAVSNHACRAPKK